MNRYRYKAIDQEGKYVTGKISAENLSDLTTSLHQSNLELISYKIEKPFNSGFSLFDSIRLKDLVSTFIYLEQLVRAGILIIDAVNDLKENSSSPKIRNLMSEIHKSIKNGNLFSQSLAKHPEIFSSTYVGLIAMGEKTGNLAESFASIVEDLKWNIELRRKTKKAITGPLFGLILMFGVLGTMTTVVVPKVTAFLTAQDLKLPTITIALVNFSNFMQSYWLLLLLSVPAILLTIKILRKSDSFALKIDDLKLKVPVIGPILNRIEAAKFCQFFAMTFKSGIGVLECLDSAGGAISNRAIKNSISNVRQRVMEGKSLAKSIAETGYFPPLVSQMFRIGEESGNMDDALKNINFFYNQEVNDSIDRLVGMIHPALTLIMGGMVAWIAIAVFGPIYGTFSAIK